MQLYNTLSREKEEFVPLKNNEVTFYSCGPTVYNYPHIGNYRAYIFADTLKRVLNYCGYNVHHITNLTDVDDKTIRDSQKEGKSLKEFTEFYTAEFYEDLKSLNILPPEKFTKATDNIPAMVELIEKLLEKGLAYKSEDGSVYFNIKKFKNYGQLAHIVLDQQKENAGGRIVTDEYDKDNVQDFALWKAWDEKDGDVFWETGLGKGRPGWHIECSAMSMKFLGEQIDIHTGGVDLIFPHHENEIAQSEGATEKQFVKYWMHNEWVLVDQKKMAKSAQNFYTLRDLMEKGINPLAYRFWLLMASYRTRVNFVWEALEGAETALKRLYNLYNDLGEAVGTPVLKYQESFKKYVQDDLDTPRGLSLLWDVLKDEHIDNADKKATILDFDKVLGLDFVNLKADVIPVEVMELVALREQARTDKDFKLSDEIRAKINALGYEVKDTADGQKILKM
ncbi:MAG: cysteine--tRNA ligase [Candidatus Pacebacteria bacterium]|nr:cysteine--tRNA ligase [Candidatus Paceibacterota bacterium]